MTTMIGRIRTQGPRALRVAVLAFLAGVLLYLGRPGTVGPLPVPLYTGLMYAAFVTPAAVLTAVFLPALVALSDAVQWARLGVAALTAAFPAVMRPVVDTPVLSATLVILCGTALVALQRRQPAVPAAV